MSTTQSKTGDESVNHFIGRYRARHGYPRSHAVRIKQELKDAGADLYDLLLPETKSLPAIIHESEHIEAVVYGRYEEGTAMLVATNKRVMFLDKKFMFIKYDDIKYSMISAVSMSQVGLAGIIILHTRLGDYSLKTLNLRAARQFYEYIDESCIEQKEKIND